MDPEQHRYFFTKLMATVILFNGSVPRGGGGGGGGLPYETDGDARRLA